MPTYDDHPDDQGHRPGDDRLEWGPEPAPPTGPRRAATAAVAVLALLLAGAVGVAWASGDPPASPLAAAGSGDDATSGPKDDRAAKAEKVAHGMLRGRGHAFAHGFGGHLGGRGQGWRTGVLHGEYVVADGAGGHRTLVTQRGEVTGVAAGSVTVRSEDGFTRTYEVTAATTVTGGAAGVKSFAAGDAVAVLAERRAGALRASHVADAGRWEDLRSRLEKKANRPGTDAT